MTTATGPELPGRPPLRDQLTGLVARLRARNTGADEHEQFVADLAPRTEPEPEPDVDGGRHPEPADTGNPYPARDTGSEPEYVEQALARTFRRLTHQHHDDLFTAAHQVARPNIRLGISATSAAHAADTATMAASLAEPVDAVEPTPRDLGILVTDTSRVAHALIELVRNTNRQLAKLHQRARAGGVAAPPGADPQVEVEQIVNNLLAVSTSLHDARLNLDTAVARLARLTPGQPTSE